MKDAFGGIVNIILIALFLVIVEGVLGLVVNYTKAFKMKNNIISSIEKYEGNEKSCSIPGNACFDSIQESAEKIGYSPSSLNCPSGSGYKGVGGLFCYKIIKSEYNRVSYRVITNVDINIPIIRHIMGLSFFQVTGDTRMIDKP